MVMVLLVPRELTQHSPGSTARGQAVSDMNKPVHVALLEEVETPFPKQTFWVY